jgi:hypothetical protein
VRKSVSHDDWMWKGDVRLGISRYVQLNEPHHSGGPEKADYITFLCQTCLNIIINLI